MASRFLPTHCSTALMIRQMGGTDMQLAAALGCELIEISRWKARYPQFAEACKVGGEMANERVKDALYHRAVGFHHKAVRHDKLKVGGTDEVVETEYTAFVPPDVTAAKYWLENRDPDNWASTVKREVTGKNGEPLIPTNGVIISDEDIDGMSDDQLSIMGDLLASKIERADEDQE